MFRFIWRNRAFFILIVLSGVYCAISYLVDDVSWFLVLGQRVLGGERPYIDFFDPNPPAAIYLYLPAVLGESWTGISAEAYVVALTILAASSSVYYTAHLLRRYGAVAASASLKLEVVAAFSVLLLPAHAFAEREHFALIGLLPYLAIAIVRIVGRVPAKSDRLIAGSVAGCALCLKPFFVLPALLVTLYLLHGNRRRPFALLLSAENLAAIAVMAIYVISILRFMPGYFDVAVPQSLAIYGPSRKPLLMFLRCGGTVLLFASMATLALAFRIGRANPLSTVFTLAGLGFAAGYVIQGKGYPYHALPAVALFLLAAVAVFTDGFQKGWLPKPIRGRERVVLAAAALSVGLALVAEKAPLGYPDYFQIARNVSAAHPKVFALTASLTGPFLARHLNGVSVSYTASLYMSLRGAAMLQEPGLTSERYRQIQDSIRWDESLQMRSLAQKPDLLVADEAGRQWAMARPAVMAELRRYEVVGNSDGYTLLIRR